MTAPPDGALALDGVTVRFGEFTAVDGVTLRVGEGEIFGLLGPNGSGKTTLIRALCGLLPMAAGSASVLGEDVAGDPARVRRSVAYMSQHFSLYEDLTAAENLAFFGGIYGLSGARRRERTAELVAMTGLEPYLHRRAGRLSGGWKQRLALACALLHRPRLVFLDEPTAGIDPVARRDVWNLLFRLSAEDVTLFVTTHSMDEAERCNRVGYLHLSRLLAVGAPAELKRLPAVTPPGTKRLEIEAAGVADVLERLRGRPGVREATIFGQAVRALVDEGVRPADLGLEDASVRETGPGLEDVFLALSRERGGGDGGGR